MKHSLLLVSITTVYLLINSCKKSGNDSPDFGQGLGNCRLSVIHTSLKSGQPVETYTCRYDHEGRLSGTVSQFADGRNYSDTIEYTSTRILRRSNDSAGKALPYADTILLDSKGRAISITTQSGPRRTFYDYGPDGKLSHVKMTDASGFVYEVNCVWENGDLVGDSTADGRMKHVYHYDLSRKWQIASQQLFSPNFLLVCGIQSTHVLISQELIYPHSPNYNSTQTFKQEFDGNGRLIKYTYPDSSVAEYSYECL
jgi:hypothetical protein